MSKKYDYWKAIDHVPKNCGYEKRFKYDIDMHMVTYQTHYAIDRNVKLESI